MVQNIETIRRAFVVRLKEAASEARIPDWGLGVRLAEMTGTTPKAASKWLNMESMPGRSNMIAIASELRVRAEWLQFGELPKRASDLSNGEGAHSNALPVVSGSPKKERPYPVISWVAAGTWRESPSCLGDYAEMIDGDIAAGEDAYWLEVSGKSMFDPTGQAPISFPPGYRILVRPRDFEVVNGKYYVARLLSPHSGDWETTFKQYVREGGADYLQPINPSFETIRMDDGVQIIGRVIDSRAPASKL